MFDEGINKSNNHLQWEIRRIGCILLLRIESFAVLNQMKDNYDGLIISGYKWINILFTFVFSYRTTASRELIILPRIESGLSKQLAVKLPLLHNDDHKLYEISQKWVILEGQWLTCNSRKESRFASLARTVFDC